MDRRLEKEKDGIVVLYLCRPYSIMRYEAVYVYVQRSSIYILTKPETPRYASLSSR